jgi:hypothetical protein
MPPRLIVCALLWVASAGSGVPALPRDAIPIFLAADEEFLFNHRMMFLSSQFIFWTLFF